MSNPVISNLPPAPVRGDSPEIFTNRANALLGSLSQLQSELNILSDWINSTSDAINLAKNTTVSVKDTAVVAKNTAVSARDTAVVAKNTAVSARDTAVVAKNEAVAAKNTAVAISQGGNVLATDALRASGDNIYLVKGDNTSESVAFVATNSARALNSNALRISGANIQLVKANGTSEMISVGTLYKNVSVGAIGSTVTALRTGYNQVTNFGEIISGSSLRVSNSNNYSGLYLSGSWICTGYGAFGLATTWKRVS